MITISLDVRLRKKWPFFRYSGGACQMNTIQPSTLIGLKYNSLIKL